jgi:protein SCO1/2
MKHYLKPLIIPLLFLFIYSPKCFSAEELGIYENLDKFIPENLKFTDENGKQIILNSLIDKPTVINLVYYECPGLCSPLLEGIANVITKAKLDLGSEYQVFTISFDPGETTKLAQMKKATYAALVKGKDVENGWKYFTGDQENINKLLNALGYKIKQEGQEYIHPAAIMILSPKGKITRYLHGVYFLPFDLKMAVTEAMDGRSGPTINKVLQYCFSYDAEGKKYVLNFTKISGTLILLLALGLFSGLVFRNKKKKSQKA